MLNIIAIKQLDRSLADLRLATARLRPKAGWIATVLDTLGMTRGQLASRLGIDPSGVTRYQSRERDGTITLDKLRRAADALDSDLVYAFVPRSGSYEEMVTQQAKLMARRELGLTRRSMALDAQHPTSAALELQVELLARRLVDEQPSQLWNDDD